MTSLQLAGYFASILIGISLGLIGGGGSILTLPVLVYLLGFNPVISTTYSLFVVGATSLVGSVNYMRRHQVSYLTGAVFALPSFVAIYLTRHYLMPLIPDPVLHTSSLVISKNVALMVLFAGVMLTASIRMIQDHHGQPSSDDQATSFRWRPIAAQGLLVGTLTGLVGAGGGFLIIPALVLLAHLPMKTAVGTSLLIIAANSLFGFVENCSTRPIDWSFLLEFTALSVIGIGVGTYLTRFVSGEKLKKFFGWFVLVMSLSILGRELFF